MRRRHERGLFNRFGHPMCVHHVSPHPVRHFRPHTQATRHNDKKTPQIQTKQGNPKAKDFSAANKVSLD